MANRMIISLVSRFVKLIGLTMYFLRRADCINSMPSTPKRLTGSLLMYGILTELELHLDRTP